MVWVGFEVSSERNACNGVSQRVFLERRIIVKLQNCLFMEFDIGRVC